MVEIIFINLQNSNYDNPNMKINLLLVSVICMWSQAAFLIQVWRQLEIQIINEADNGLPALL